MNKNAMMKYNKLVFNIKNIALFVINIIAFLYLINLFNINNDSIRRLAEQDNRSKKPNQICMEIIGYTLFDFFNLSTKNVSGTSDDDGIIELKFCENINDYKSTCILKKDGKVIKLAGDVSGEDKNYNRIIIDNYDKKKERVANIYLAAGDKCKSEKYKVKMQLKCDENEEFKLDEEIKLIESNCNLDIKAKSKYACGIDDKYNLLPVNNILAGVIVLIIGIIIGILSYNQVNLAIILVFFASFLFIFLIIIVLFDIQSYAIQITLLVLSLIISLVLSILFIKKKKTLFKYYMFLICGLCGYALGELICNQFLSLIDTTHQKLIRYLVIAGFIVIGIVLGMCFPKYIYIIGTSIIGSYLTMRGLSFLLYSKVPYIEENKLYDLAHSGNFDMITDMALGLFLIYPILLIILIVIYIIAQIKINPNWKEMSYKDLNETVEQIDVVSDYMLPNN